MKIVDRHKDGTVTGYKDGKLYKGKSVLIGLDQVEVKKTDKGYETWYKDTQLGGGTGEAFKVGFGGKSEASIEVPDEWADLTDAELLERYSLATAKNQWAVRIDHIEDSRSVVIESGMFVIEWEEV